MQRLCHFLSGGDARINNFDLFSKKPMKYVALHKIQIIMTLIPSSKLMAVQDPLIIFTNKKSLEHSDTHMNGS